MKKQPVYTVVCWKWNQALKPSRMRTQQCPRIGEHIPWFKKRMNDETLGGCPCIGALQLSFHCCADGENNASFTCLSCLLVGSLCGNHLKMNMMAIKKTYSRIVKTIDWKRLDRVKLHMTSNIRILHWYLFVCLFKMRSLSREIVCACTCKGGGMVCIILFPPATCPLAFTFPQSVFILQGKDTAKACGKEMLVFTGLDANQVCEVAEHV